MELNRLDKDEMHRPGARSGLQHEGLTTITTDVGTAATQGPDTFYPAAMVEREKGYYSGLLAQHKLQVTVYLLVFTSFGMCVGFLGPTLWDLGCKTGTMLPTMTYVFFSQSFFVLIGSMLAGLLIEEFSSNAVLLAGTLGITASYALIPSCASEVHLGAVLAAMGLSMGLIDTTSNVSMIRLFKTDVSPFLQALHFCYGIGAFLSPLIAAPFLQNYDCDTLIDNTTVQDTASVSYIERALRDEKPELKAGEVRPATLLDAQVKLTVDDVFYIMSILQIPALIAVVAMMISQRCRCKFRQEYNDIDEPKTKGFPSCFVAQSASFILLVVSTGFFLFLADGIQATFGGIIYTYAKLAVDGINSSTAATLNAGFWGTFALGRLIAIGLAVYLSPGFLLFLDVTGCLCAMFMMLMWPTHFAVLSAGTLLFGLALSNVAPSALATAEQFVEIGPSSTSIIVVGAAAGEAFYPVLIGHMMDKHGTLVFLVAGNITVCVMALTYLLMLLFGFSSKKQSATHNWLRLLFPFAFRGEEEDEGEGPLKTGPTVPYQKMTPDADKDPDPAADDGHYQ